PDLEERDAQRVGATITRLLDPHDTTTVRADVAAVADAYSALADRGRVRFFSLLARDFWNEPAAVDHAISQRNAAVGDAARRAAERTLRNALIPSTERLLKHFAGIDDGVKFLVDLRADELRLATGAVEPDDAIALADLDIELKAQLTTLFDVGLLELRRITWDTPAALLEKLIEYEAVHAIESWTDLKNRLDSDRRCYAFFHRSMPSEPLVFVEIALTAGLACELAPLLDAHAPELDPDRADTAVFYSISNCQPGLAGVNLGTALIKQVIEELRRDLPKLHHFVTLSPIPGFRAWLDTTLHEGDLRAHERDLLPAAPDRVLARLADTEWDADEAIEPALEALCARYLTTTRDGRVLDPVENFHLTNGAVVERINWLADPTPIGRERSATLMVNYTYEPDRIAARADAYVGRGEVATSNAVRELLGKSGH
ncbi:MAG: malonyl-CoA decarboxylase, partial [Actinomycetota bacterium]|nr:malonyl-CoA decarboxylase [Actinomycetota bacterium]